MARIPVLKTYKIFINGQFPRTESGRYYPLSNKAGRVIANVCLSSRKDFKNAQVAARNAQESWAAKTAFNRGQILYRIAEMLEGRRAQFIEELLWQGSTKRMAETEVALAVDRLIYYAGWCDKFQLLYSSINPVASSHLNFSMPEPCGVVALIAPNDSSLLGLVSMLAPVMAGGNTCVALASSSAPLCAVSFAEVLATADVPAGVVNIVTGSTAELHEHFSSHMDVNALVYGGNDTKELKTMRENCALNVKRFFHWRKDWFTNEAQSPYLIGDLQEIKTTWHPLENIGASGSKY